MKVHKTYHQKQNITKKEERQRVFVKKRENKKAVERSNSLS